MRHAKHVHVDVETKCHADLKRVGAFEYASHKTIELKAIAWQWETEGVLEPTYTWHAGQSEKDLPVFDSNKIIIHAHNSGFERNVWNEFLCKWKPKHFRRHPITGFRCSMARAAMLGLPGALGALAKALGLKEWKDDDGAKQMKAICVPSGKNRIYLNPDPTFEDYERLAKYCAQDVKVEVAADKKMGPLTPAELQVWFMDQEINAHGLQIDREQCENALRIITEELKVRGESLDRLTGGYVQTVNQNKKIAQWVTEQGVPCNSVAADVIDNMMTQELPDDVREVLQIRRDTKTSTSKYSAMLQRSKVDGRMRDNLRYHGAGPGRWAGVGAQIQNFPRGLNDDEGGTIAARIAESFVNTPDDVWLDHGDVVEAGKNALRAAIISAPGRKLLVWDYSQIEARVLPWLAGEKWKIKAFENIDAGLAPDIYIQSYAQSFVTPMDEVTKAQRQVGKCEELALGYQGGPRAFVSFGKIYRVDIGEYYEELCDNFPNVSEKAHEAWKKRGRKEKNPLHPKVWIAAEIVKICWRAKHPATCQFWYDLQDASIGAVMTGTKTTAGRVKFLKRGSYLKMILPSGRPLSYYRPRVVEVKNCRCKNGCTCRCRCGLDDCECLCRCAKKCRCTSQLKLTYWRTQNGKLVRDHTYGGKLAENATQGSARCVMTDGMLRLREALFDMGGSVHDEVIAEEDEAIAVPRLEQGKRLLEVRAPWCRTMPIKIGDDCFAADRYRK